MVKIFYGNEPWLISKEKERIVSGLSLPEMNLLSFQMWGNDVLDALQTLPFIDERRVVILDLEKPSSLDCKSFKAYLGNPSNTADLIIQLREADLRTKFCAELKKGGFITIRDKFKDEISLINEIGSYLKEKEATMTKEALSLFLHRENYFELPEITFFTLANDLDTLISINKSISKEMVAQFIPDNATVNDFALAKLILSGNATAVRCHINMVSDSDAMRIIALLLREYRIAYKALYFKESEIGVKFVSLKNKLSKEHIISSIEICTSAMDDIKAGRLGCEYALKVVTGKLLALGK